ncbi:hypothetical protein ACJX0J_039063, partial [Zea mays]
LNQRTPFGMVKKDIIPDICSNAQSKSFIISATMLKRRGDKGSSCRKPFLKGHFTLVITPNSIV